MTSPFQPTAAPQSLLDTLRLLSGGGELAVRSPSSAQDSAFLGNSPAGMLNPRLLLLTDKAKRAYQHRGQIYQPDWILSHEMGHRFVDLVQKMNNRTKPDWQPTRVQSQAMRLVHDLVGAGQRGVATDSLAGEEGQYFAQAFANAVDFLRNTGSAAQTPEARKFLAKREAAIPGTTHIVQFLLRTPFYGRAKPNPESERTRLTPAAEQRFQAWAGANQIRDVDDPQSFYDYRGYWLSNRGKAVAPGQHLPDTFKQHGHPTFSVESQYSKGGYDGGRWVGDKYMPPQEAFLSDLVAGLP